MATYIDLETWGPNDLPVSNETAVSTESSSGNSKQTFIHGSRRDVNKHVSTFLPYIGMVKVKDGEYWCKLCKKLFFASEKIKNHVKDPTHKHGLKIYGCDQILHESSNLYYCRWCDCTLMSRKLVSYHITEEKHMGHANLPCISIKLVSATLYHCRICNVTLSTWGKKVRIHVNEARHKKAQKEYGYKNILLLKDNLYYCSCCDFALSSREIAFQHCTEEKHIAAVRTSKMKKQPTIKALPNAAQTTKQSKIEPAADSIKEEEGPSYDRLPCISIEPLKDRKFFCRICNVKCSSETDLKVHAKGLRHRTAQMVNGCNHVSVKEDAKYYCGCCDCVLANRELAFEHTKEEEHKSNANLPCLSIKLRAINEYHCRICNINISGKNDLSSHVIGRRHTEAQNHYGCNNISLKEDNLYYCGWCDCTLKSRTQAFDHIEDRHMSNVELPCISIVPVDVNKYHCTICNVDISGQIDLEKHVKDKQHAGEQKKHGCDNISRGEDHLYYCGCCDCSLSSRKLAAQHINEEKHMNALKLSHDKHQLIRKAIPKMAESKNRLVHSYILEENTDFYCTVCNYPICGQMNDETHAKEKQHTAALQKFRDNKISVTERNVYYCKYCSCKISGYRNLHEHLRGYRHAVTKAKHKREVITPQWFHFHFLTKVRENLYCGICNADVQDGEDHIMKNEHIIGLHEFHENRISLKGSDYYCKYCSCKIFGFWNVHQHIRGPKHAVAMGKNRFLEIGDQKQQTSNKIPAKVKRKKRDNVSECTAMDFLHHFNVKEGEIFECRVCNTDVTSLKDHIMEKQHQIALQIFDKNKISFKRTYYYCNICARVLWRYPNVCEHVQEQSHILLLTFFEQKKEIARTIAAHKARFYFEEISRVSEMYNLSLDYNELIKAEKRFSAVTSKKKGVRTWPLKEIYAIRKGSAEMDEMRCNLCHAVVKGTTELHTHISRHLSRDFIISDKNEKSTVQQVVKRREQFKLPKDLIDRLLKEIEQEKKMGKIQMIVNFDIKSIYSMNDKFRDIELGMKFLYPLDKDITYCFVCQKHLEISTKDYYQHFTSLDHCEFLDQMESDHKLFDSFTDQFSQLDLALDYIADTNGDRVFCLLCEQEFSDIWQHIDDQNHIELCAEMHAKAKKHFENMKLMSTSWYEIQFYWCLPCGIRCESEVEFENHFESEIHARSMKHPRNMEKKLIFDFCQPCAMLWYGWRCSTALHEMDSPHRSLTFDRHYLSTEIPESAKLLLTDPEDFLTKTIKFLDKVSAKERSKEAMFIRDIEKSVASKFLDAKAYIFGSRVTGLGLPDGDIDVFLDCGNMYNGDSSSTDRFLDYRAGVHECLSKEPHLWDVQALLPPDRSLVVRVRHRVTGLYGDISFENGLPVENTLLIKSLIDRFPPCRKMILIVKEWLKRGELSGFECITNYAICWCVIFHLQNESILPSIAKLTEMANKSHIICGWEVGVLRDFTPNALEHDLSIKELLVKFFKLYANFDYEYNVVCPLLGEVVAKRAFRNFNSLPEAMAPYKATNFYANFRTDSGLCIQDPFNLEHNITEAVSRVYVNRFRKYCSKSLDVLHEF